MRHSRDFLTKWVIALAQFERWVNVLADNDNAVPPADLSLHAPEIPAVSLLSFY